MKKTDKKTKRAEEFEKTCKELDSKLEGLKNDELFKLLEVILNRVTGIPDTNTLYFDGRDAVRKGKTIDDNPYRMFGEMTRIARLSNSARCWNDGFYQNQTEK